jgi:hypothetical protein
MAKPCRLTNVQYLLWPVQAAGFETVKPALVRTFHLSARTYSIVKNWREHYDFEVLRHVFGKKTA